MPTAKRAQYHVILVLGFKVSYTLLKLRLNLKNHVYVAFPL
jgi:hypothetical protein